MDYDSQKLGLGLQPDYDFLRRQVCLRLLPFEFFAFSITGKKDDVPTSASLSLPYNARKARGCSPAVPLLSRINIIIIFLVDYSTYTNLFSEPDTDNNSDKNAKAPCDFRVLFYGKSKIFVL
jgi:hypothetical protein